MTKETYKQILHKTTIPEMLDGIIRVAMYDNDIKLDDYAELLDEQKKIITKERGDKK